MATQLVTITLERDVDAPGGLRARLDEPGLPGTSEPVATLAGDERTEWWRDLVSRARAAIGGEVQPWRVGAELRDLLLPGAVGDRLANLETPTRHLGVVVRLGPGLDHLWGLPWELVHRERKFLLAAGDVTIVRSVGDRPPDVDAEPVRRVLAVDGPSEVTGLPPLPVSTLDGDIRYALGHRVELTPLAEPTVEVLAATLARMGSVDILVFRGHGHEDGLWLRDPTGRHPSAIAPTDELAAALAGRARLAVLVSCRAGASQAGTGVAQGLAHAGIATIACQSTIESPAATGFVRSFFKALDDGQDLLEATALARTALRNTENYAAASARVAVWVPGPVPPRLVVGPTREERDEAGLVDRHAIDEIQRAHANRGVRLVHLVGDEGSGRTAIVRELCRRMDGQAFVPEHGCSSRAVADAIGPRLWALARRRGAWRDRAESLDTDEAIWDAIIDELVTVIDPPAPELLLLLDDADGLPADLARNLSRLPWWVTVVLVGRPGLPELGHRRENIEVVDLAADDAAFRTYAAALLRDRGCPAEEVDDALEVALGPHTRRTFPAVTRAVDGWLDRRWTDPAPRERWGAVHRRGEVTLLIADVGGPVLEPAPTEPATPLDLDGSAVLAPDGRVAASLVAGLLELAWVDRTGPKLRPWRPSSDLDLHAARLLAVAMSGEDGARCLLSLDGRTVLVRARPSAPARVELVVDQPSRAGVICREGVGTIDLDGKPREEWLRRRLPRVRLLTAIDAVEGRGRSLLAALGEDGIGRATLVLAPSGGRATTRRLDGPASDLVVVRPLDGEPTRSAVLVTSGVSLRRYDGA